MQQFLAGKIKFTDIPGLVEQTLDEHKAISHPDLEEIMAADDWAREKVMQLVWRQIVILTIVIGIVALSVLIIVHELGHFIAAKATGVPVEEFGIGFPPRAYGRKWRGTIYSINWIPFGGFNKIAGEVDPAVPRGLASRGYGVRLLVLSGGIVMSLLLPFVLLAVAYMVPHDIVSGRVVIEDVSPNSPADIAGILPGDAIISVNDHPLKNAGELSRYVQLNLGKEITVSLEHADATTETVKSYPPLAAPRRRGSHGGDRHPHRRCGYRQRKLSPLGSNPHGGALLHRGSCPLQERHLRHDSGHHTLHARGTGGYRAGYRRGGSKRDKPGAGTDGIHQHRHRHNPADTLPRP